MKIILTGGGTGGHLFPAIALAEIFKERDSGNEITFIGSKKGLEAKILYKYGFHLETLDVGGVKGKGLLNRAISILKALMGIFKSIKLIRRYMPDLVVGAGGYSAFPVVAAAKIMKVMTIILEQNTLPGITNRYLGRFVDRVFVAFPDAKKYFPKGKVVVSGNPVRKEILKAKGERRKAKGEGFTILVFGGSQGAKAINSIFLESLEYLKHCSINIIHQTGEEDYERVKETYNKLKTQNSKLKTNVFNFIDDMADAYKMADLIICRSGATSIAEITALGKASILIPYPFAADNHQEVNARYLADRGAAVMFKQEELDGAKLAHALTSLYENLVKIKEIEERAHQLGMPDAASIIVEDIYRGMHV